MTYSQPFNFAVSYIKIISQFPTQMLCFPTQLKVGTLCVKNHQVLRLEHRLGLMEILKNLKEIFLFKKIEKQKLFLLLKKYIFTAI